MKKIIFLLFIFFMNTACIHSQNNDSIEMKKYDEKDALVELKTNMGDIVVELYNDTPLHRDNFLKLVSEGFYDGVLFHRVIDSFMIQTGDPKSKDAEAGSMLGTGDPGYTIEAEINYPRHFHKYGALAAARTGDNVNPEKRSSGSQFYIVTGKKVNETQLENMYMRGYEDQLQKTFRDLAIQHRDSIESMQKAGDSEGLEKLRQQLIKETEEKVNVSPMPEEMKAEYLANGGTPHLDGAYTVFGQVIKGMDIVEKIQKMETDSHDRPLEDIKIISAKIIKDKE